MNTPILRLRAGDIAALYESRDLSPVEVVRACLGQIAAHNPAFNAVCHTDAASALRQARAAEKRWKAGKSLGPLDGIPVTVKDWFDVKGWPTRYGCTFSSAAPQEKDSPCVARLREAGAVFIAKTTLPEYGHKGVTDSALHGVTRNPWDATKTSGGSSGGAAVAAATGMGILHVGSDAGGSIRIPAAFCGVFGFKPSPGLVSSWPPSPFASLSSAGPMTRCADDAAVMMDVLARPDRRDWNALPLPRPDFAGAMRQPLKKLKIAWADSLDGISAVPETRAALDRRMKALGTLGTVTHIKLDGPHDAAEIFGRHWMAVASWMVGRMKPAHRKKIDPRLATWAQMGDAQHLHDYISAEQERMVLGGYYKNILDDYDLLVTPTTPLSAFGAGLNMPDGKNGKPWFYWSPFTYPANLAKLPAAAVPAGLDSHGLPVSFQLMGAYLQDTLVLRAARKLEKALAFQGWLERKDARKAA